LLLHYQVLPSQEYSWEQQVQYTEVLREPCKQELSEQELLEQVQYKQE
jgi:hypothetical protein